MSDSRRRAWEIWITANLDNLAHPADYERMFVEQILAEIPEIEPSDVIAQFPFVDDQGKNCRIDFAIRNAAKGFDLMIELDGASKDTDSAHWRDYLERQNSILLWHGNLLRFSNRCMFDQSDRVIATIVRGLRRSPSVNNDLGGDIASTYVRRSYFDAGMCCAECGSVLADYWRRPDGQIVWSCALC